MMETPSDWTFQLSVKIDGEHMLNVRAQNELTFLQSIKAAVESSELILSAARALEGVRKPQHAAPVSHAPQGVIGAPAGSRGPAQPSGEFGPVRIVGVGKSSVKKDGTPMKSPKFTVEFSNGKKLATFDTLVGQAAESLSGRDVFYETKVNGEYTNLAAVRSAG
jgi:hypothetical protein